LRGRREKDVVKSFEYYDKAIAADKNNPFPYIAKGYNTLQAGDLKKALDYYSIAERTITEKAEMEDIVFNLRLALGKYDQLEKETMVKFLKTPSDYNLFERLMKISTKKGTLKQIGKIKDKFLIAYKKEYPEFYEETKANVEITILYLSKDFDNYRKSIETLPKDNTDRGIIKYISDINQFKVKEASEYFEGIDGIESPIAALVMMLGCNNKSLLDTKMSQKWLNKAIELFSRNDSEHAEIVKMLQKKGKLDIGTIDRIQMDAFSDKAIIFTALAIIYPEKKKELLRKAKNLNYEMFYPHFFLETVIKNKEE